MKVPTYFRLPLFLLMSPVMIPLGLFFYIVDFLDRSIDPLGNFWADLIENKETFIDED